MQVVYCIFNLTHNELLSVHFFDTNTGWAVGSIGSGNSRGGIVVKTTDGGNSWTEHKFGQTIWTNDVYFIDANIGWMTGGGDVLKTNDGGDNWNVVSTNLSDKLNSISFIDENVGWTVGGWNGSIHKTDYRGC